MKKFLLSVVLLGLIGGAAAAAYVYHQYNGFLERPLRLTEQTVLNIPSGTSYRKMVRQLAGQGWTDDDWKWRLLAQQNPVIIKAGEYRLPAQIKPLQLLELLSSGQVISYNFTIIEGWSYKQLRAALLADPTLQQTLQELDGTELMNTLGATEQHPEGQFLPETYQFNRGDTDLSILKRAYQAQQKALQTAWSARSEELPLKSPYELLILASIIEKETSVESERDRIAGVFTRRLQRGMKLQTDPTVIYGLGDAYDGDIRYRDLRTDTPYNTYTRAGLPPTPIAMPGVASLNAAASPKAGDALYFVADGSGGHTFSATLREHNQAVRKMLRTSGR